jgi:hypothetical protein
MPQKVLNEDWSEYDNRKKRYTDSKFFSCTESWEVDYLVRKITKVYPAYSESIVRAAIGSCCAMTSPNHPRPAFVECVMNRLRR